MVGDYIDRVFPVLRIRFVSILDDYDSSDPMADRGKICLALKGIVNELYPQDISRRVSDVFWRKQLKGDVKPGGTVPYGYVVRQGELVYSPDYRTLKIVRKIYGWLIGGSSIHGIKRRLYSRHILAPAQYRTSGKVCGDEVIKAKVWCDKTIKGILKNLEYTGTRVCHKTETCLYKDVPPHNLAENEWIKIGCYHPAIIPREIYDRAQIILENRRSIYTGGTGQYVEGLQSLDKNIFTGIIRCGNCGGRMRRRKAPVRVKGKLCYRRGYVCGVHGDMRCLCRKKCVWERALCMIIIQAVKGFINQMEDIGQVLEDMHEESFKPVVSEAVKEHRRTQNDQKLLFHKRIDAYASYVEKRMTAEQYQAAAKEYGNEILCLKHREDMILKNIRQLEEAKKHWRNAEEIFLTGSEVWADMEDEDWRRLMEGLVQTFVKAVYVYDDNRVEVVL